MDSVEILISSFMQSIDIIFCLKVTLFEIFNAQLRLLFILSLSRNSICVHGKRKKKKRERKGRNIFTCTQRLDVNHVALVIGVILARHLAKLDITEMKYSCQDTIHRINLPVLKSKQFKPGFQLLELVYMRLRRLTMVGQESMILSKIEIQVEFREAAVRLQAIVHVIKYMKITLPSETRNRLVD